MSAGGIHLFLGPDRLRKLQRIRELERELGIHPLDRHRLDAASATPAELLALCRQRPATSPRRLIVVDQAHRLVRTCVEALLQHAASITQTACLILLVETELGLRQALAQLTQAVSVERFAGGEPLPSKPFALTDALGSRDVAGALAALHDQLRAGKEPLELLGLIAWQLQRWVAIRRLRDAGESMERIASMTGLRPWHIQRAQAEVAHRTLDSLQALLTRCWQLDVDAKSGRINSELAIEMLAVEACLGERCV